MIQRRNIYIYFLETVSHFTNVRYCKNKHELKLVDENKKNYGTFKQ